MATWAQRRRLMIISAGVLAVLLIASVITALALYRAPMCTDGKQNGKETGIDCGGPCPYLCSADMTQPQASFAVPLSPQSGRTDFIAYIPNTNPTAGIYHAKYTLELRDSQGSLITTKQGTINLPPNTTAPLFIPRAYQGSQRVAQAFLTLDPSSLVYPRTYQRPILPLISNVDATHLHDPAPKVTATLVNQSARAMYGVEVVITIFDAKKNAIGASETYVPTLPAQGTAPLVFTWNAPFSSTPASIDILPATGS